MDSYFKKSLIIFSLLIILCVSLSVVSANEDITVDDVSSVNLANQDIENEIISSESSVDSNSNKDISTYSESENQTFDDIQQMIDNAELGDEIELSGNYLGNGNQILINKALTINGNGATLDAQGLSRSFNITAKNVIINNLNLVNGKSTNNGDQGGAIHWTGANGKLTNCTFDNNSAIFENYTTLLGGVIYWNASNGIIEDCTFKDSYAFINYSSEFAYIKGGVISFIGNDFIMNNCNFTNSYSFSSGSYTYGGVIFLQGKNCSVTNSYFFNNTQYTHFSYGYYGNHYTYQYGGVIFWNGNYIKISDCTFENNTVYGNNLTVSYNYGGVLHLNGTNSSIENCDFIDNGIAPQRTYETNRCNAFGLINLGHSKYCTISNSNFINNEVYGIDTIKYIGDIGVYGGCICSNGTDFSVDFCNFSNNFANGSGGVISIIGAKVNISNCNFSNNSAKTGGAIYLNNSEASIKYCNFTDNIARGNGGAIYSIYSTYEVMNCIFIRNTGSSVISGANGTVNNSYFDNNTVNAIISGSNSTINNCVFGGPMGCIYTGQNSDLNNNFWGLNFNNIEEFVEFGTISSKNNNLTSWINIGIEGLDSLNYGKINECYLIFVYNNGSKSENLLYSYLALLRNKLSQNTLDREVLISNSKGKFLYDMNVLSNDEISVYDRYNFDLLFSVPITTTFNDIQKAIDNSNDGDVIEITGTFSGDFQINVNKSVTIRGVNKTTLDGQKLMRIFNITADNVVLENLNIINGFSDNGGAIFIDSSNCIINNCNFTNGVASDNGGAIFINSKNNNTIINSRFTICNATTGGAIYCIANDTTVNNCDFVDNLATVGKSIFWNATHGIINNNYFSDTSGNIEGNANVIKANSTLNSEDISWSYNDQKDLVITFIGDYDVVNKTINVVLDNGESTKTYTLVTDNEGIISINENLNPSIWNLFYSFNETDTYCSANGSVIVIVNKANTTLSNEKNITCLYNDTITLNVTISSSGVINEGIITFYLDENELGFVNVENNKVTYTFNASELGNHTIKVVYSGGDYYLNSNMITDIHINKFNTNLAMNSITCDALDYVDLIAVVNSNNVINDGNVTFWVNGVEIGSFEVINGVSNCTYFANTTGSLTVKAMYNGGSYYLSSNNKSATLKVNKLDTKTTVDVASCDVLDVVNLTAHIISNKIVNEGTVKFYINGSLITTVNVVNGTATYQYVPSKVGNFTVKANYTSGNHYISSNNSSKLTVNKKSAFLIGDDVTINYSDDVNLTIALKDIDNQPLVNKAISVKIGKSSYTFKTDENGVISIPLNEFTGKKLNVGNNVLNCTYGDSYYLADPISVNVRVIPLNSTMDLVVVNDGLILNVNAIVYSNGQYVDNGTVKFYINGSYIGYSEIINGNAKSSYVVDNSGNYSIYAIFYDNNYNSSNDTCCVSATKLKTTFIAYNTTSYVGNDACVVINLMDENGDKVRASRILVTYNATESKFIYASGDLLVIPSKFWGVGNYSISLIYEGTIDKYLSSTTTMNIEVIKGTPLITVSEDWEYVNSTVYLGCYVEFENKYVDLGSVIFYVDGVPVGTVEVDNFGYASIEYLAKKAGKFNVSSVYVGNSYYNQVVNSSTLTVDKYDASIIGFDMSTTYKDGKSLSLTLIDDYANFINGVNVVFKVYKNNVLVNTYTATSSNGLVNLPIGLGVGEYRVDASIDDWYYQGTNSFNVVVNKAKVTMSLTKSGSYYKATTLTVKLVDSVSNSPLGNENVVVKIGSNTVTLTTDANGVATYVIPYNPATYSITANASNTNIESNVPILSVKIAKAVSSVITPTALSTTYDSGKYFQIKVLSKDKKPMVGVKLKLKIYTGSKYTTVTVTTESNGIAKYSGSKLAIGKHKIIVSSAESTSYMTATAKTSYLTVNKATTTVSAPVVKNTYKKSAYFKVTVKNKATTKVVSGLALKIKVYTGSKYTTYTVKTNSKGIAQLNTKALKKGTHKVVISSGNSKYTLSKSGNLIVIK